MTDNSVRQTTASGLIAEPPRSVSALAQRIWTHHAITPGVTSSAFSLRPVQRFGLLGDGRLPLLAAIQRRWLPGGGRFTNLEPSLLYLRLAQLGPETGFDAPSATVRGQAGALAAHNDDHQRIAMQQASHLPAPGTVTARQAPDIMRPGMPPVLRYGPGSATVHAEPPLPPTSRTSESRPQNQTIPPEPPSAPESASHHAAAVRPVSRRAPPSSDEGQETQTAALQAAELADTMPTLADPSSPPAGAYLPDVNLVSQRSHLPLVARAMPAAAGASFLPIQRGAQATAQASRSSLITASQPGELARTLSRPPSAPPQLAGMGRQSHLPESGQFAASESHPERAAVQHAPAAPQGLARQFVAPAPGAPAAIQLRRAEGPAVHSMAAPQVSPLLAPRLDRGHEPAGPPTREQHPSDERAANLRASQGQSESATQAASAELSTTILRRRQPDPEEPAHRTSVATARSSSPTPQSAGPVAQPAALSYRKIDEDDESALVQTSSADHRFAGASTIPEEDELPTWLTLASPLHGSEGRQPRSSTPLVADELPVAAQKPATAGLQAAALSARAAASRAQVSLPVVERYPVGIAAQPVKRQAALLEPALVSGPLNLYRQASLPNASPAIGVRRMELLTTRRIAAPVAFQPGARPESGRALTAALPLPPAHTVQRASAGAAVLGLPLVASPGRQYEAQIQANADAPGSSVAPAPGHSVEPGMVSELPTMTAEPPNNIASGADVRQLADQVYEILVQRLATERERRGR